MARAAFGVVGAMLVCALVSAPVVASEITRPGAVEAARAGALPPELERISGKDRYETAVELSRALTPGVPVVYVATGADFPDALTAAAAAGAAGGPLLLTQTTKIPAFVLTEVKRLQPERIVVVGGESVVSASVESALNRVAPTIRVKGQDRYSTAIALSAAAFAEADEVFIATGRDYPDALVAAAAAGGRGVPVLLVNGTAKTVPASTVQELRRLGAERVSIVGGYGAVTAEVQTALTRSGFSVSRHAGGTRYDTAASVNDAFFEPATVDRVLIATGTDFPDALAGAAYAARHGEPLYVVTRTCSMASTISSVKRFEASSSLVLGGRAVVSDASARLSPCIRPDESKILNFPWDEVEIVLRDDVPVPYSDRPPVDVYAANQVLDSTGLRIYRVIGTGVRADHPVVYAQYGISALMEYERTGNRVWLDRAIRQGERLIEMRTMRGDAWWFPYKFRWTYDTRTLSAPWWSAMAQGQALSLFSRLSVVAPEPRWEAAIEGTWQSFLQAPSKTQPWSSVVISKNLFLEEYAGDQKPLQVLNGQIFAMFGIYDYWLLSGDADAERMLRASSATVLDMMPSVRKPGGVSYYCVQDSYCQRPRWQNEKYHVIHSWQLDTLQTITQVEEFGEWATLLRQDWRPRTRTQAGDVEDSLVLSVDPLDADIEGLGQ